MNRLRSQIAFLLYCVCILLTVFAGYSQIHQLYFSNDEFKFIAGVQTDGLFFLLNRDSWIQVLIGLYRPLGTLIQNAFYLTSNNSTTPFIVFGLVTHVANCILLYFLVRKITNNGIVAYCAGIIFASLSVYIQSISWLACIVEVPGSTFFTLVSLYALVCYQTESKQYRWLMVSLLAAYIAFLIKDASVFLFGALPCVLFMYEWKRRKFTMPYYVFSAVTAIVFVVIRIQSLKTVASERFLALSGVKTLFDGGSAYIQSIYHAFLYPLIGIIQIITPTRFIQKIIDSHSFMTPPRVDLGLAGLALLVCWILYHYFKKFIKDLKPMIMVVLLYVSSFIPIALILEKRGSAFIESRYMYFPTMMFSVILGYLVLIAIQSYQKNTKHAKIFITVILICFGIYLLKQISLTRNLLYGSIKEQQDIKNVFEQLARYQKQVPDNPIFYLTSDYDYFWPNNKVPFQEGTGYMLQVIYLPSGKIPKDLVRNYYLEPFGLEGYQAIEGRGFGYFHDKDKLVELYKKNPLFSTEQIIAFRYSSQTKKIDPITEEIRTYVSSMRYK
jgi:hypothetical protein